MGVGAREAAGDPPLACPLSLRSMPLCSEPCLLQRSSIHVPNINPSLLLQGSPSAKRPVTIVHSAPEETEAQLPCPGHGLGNRDALPADPHLHPASFRGDQDSNLLARNSCTSEPLLFPDARKFATMFVEQDTHTHTYICPELCDLGQTSTPLCKTGQESGPPKAAGRRS